MLETRRGYRQHSKAGPDPGIRNPHPGMASFLLSKQAGKPALEAAEDIAKIAQATAPRSKGPGPHMADGYRAEPANITAPTVPVQNPRLGAQVVNDRPGAVQTEFGGPRNAKQRTLLRAGARIGQTKTQP